MLPLEKFYLFMCEYMISANEKSRQERHAETERLIWRHDQRVARYRRHQQMMRRRFQALITYKSLVENRKFWVKERNSDFWLSIENFQPEDWKENFRMSKETFMELVQMLRPWIEKESTNFRNTICPEKRIAICLYRLTTNCDFRTLQNLFGVGKSTAFQVTDDVVEAICAVMFRLLIKFPRGARVNEVTSHFKEKTGFPQVIGLIDGSHIPIISPSVCPADYFNRKQFHSVVLQAVVSEKYLFSDIFVGFPGKAHDARVFVNSSLYEKGTKGQLIENYPEELNGVFVNPVLLGDAAYPLLPWLMKPYPENLTTPNDKKRYNFLHSSTRMGVENAFGRLKGRFRCILKRLDMAVEMVPKYVTACRTLHNWCEMHNEEIDRTWLDTDTQLGISSTELGGVVDDVATDYNNRNAESVRNALCTYLWNL